jgi:hypothetical protein
MVRIWTVDPKVIKVTVSSVRSQQGCRYIAKTEESSLCN